jgi:hypothetical protein
MLALAGLVSGCEPAPLTSTVFLYWDFFRIVPSGLTGAGTYPYDCIQAGVDYVTISDDLGFFLGTFDCVQPSSAPPATVQGIGIADVPPGPRTFFVTGYRRATSVGDVALFSGQASASVVAGVVTDVSVLVDGIPANVVIDLPAIPTCTSVVYYLYDGAHTFTDSASAPCDGFFVPALISLTGATLAPDRDNYFMWVDGYDGATLQSSTCFAFDNWGPPQTLPVLAFPVSASFCPVRP